MPAKGKELRVHIEPHKHAWITAVAKARRTTPSRIINEMIDDQLNLQPRLEAAMIALERARKDGDRIGVIRDFIADLYAADDSEN